MARTFHSNIARGLSLVRLIPKWSTETCKYPQILAIPDDSSSVKDVFVLYSILGPDFGGLTAAV